MSGIEARLRLRLAQFTLDATFEAPPQGVTALFGRSGSGKTTLLRCLAGLVPAEGYLRVNGETWQDSDAGTFLPTHRRPLGYVFQEKSLFAHLSVRKNLEYGLKRLPRTERRVRFEEAVTLLGVAPLLSRTPQQLSGGQGQRVAIARALLASPRLLLMDEPLASLDLASKAEILPYLERLHGELSIPVIYVTHSPDEVSRLADHLVLLEHGRVRAAGPLLELLTRLDLPLVHEDATVIVEATVTEHDANYHLTWVEFPGGRLTVPLADQAPGQRVRLRIHARDVSLALEKHARTSILNILPARVVEIAEEDAAQLLVKLDLGGTLLLSRITRRSGDMLGLKPGLAVYAQLKSVALVD
jgi:molybdate transport system ATP-binding protein